MKRCLLFLVIVIIGSCKSDDVEPIPSSRTFYMGFTPFPSDFTEEALDLAYQQIADHGDMILHHLDDGVPWDEALNDLPFPTEVQTNLDQRKAKIPLGHKVLLTATATKQDRKSLAGYWSDQSNGPLPDFWASKSHADPEVITAYINYCKRLIDFFDPDYFAYGIEINASFEMGTAEYSNYLTFAENTYEALKSAYPNLPIILTFQTQAFNRTQQQMLNITREMLAYSDILALSHYPYWLLETNNSQANPQDLPADWLKTYRDLDPNKPFAISETGYAADDVVLDDFGVHIEANEAWQNQFVQDLMPQLNDLQAEFVLWFVVQDYDKVWEIFEANGLGEELKIWKDTGLFEGNGTPRDALEAWDSWLDLPKN